VTGMVGTAEVLAFPLDVASDWSRADVESVRPGKRLSWQSSGSDQGVGRVSMRRRSGPFFIVPATLPAGTSFPGAR
jgi:hypothetical protein